MVLALVGLRKGMDFFPSLFSQRDLEWLDDLMPETKGKGKKKGKGKSRWRWRKGQEEEEGEEEEEEEEEEEARTAEGSNGGVNGSAAANGGVASALRPRCARKRSFFEQCFKNYLYDVSLFHFAGSPRPPLESKTAPQKSKMEDRNSFWMLLKLFLLHDVLERTAVVGSSLFRVGHFSFLLMSVRKQECCFSISRRC